MLRRDLEGTSHVGLARDGMLLIAGEGLYRVDTKSGKPTKLLALKYGGPLVVSADGTRAYVGDDKKALVVSLGKKASVEMKWSSTGDGPSSITPSPDGRFVIVAGSDEGGTLKMCEMGKPRALYTIGSVRYAQTAWLPDGTKFVTASHEWSARVKVHDAANGATLIDLGDPHPVRKNAGSKPGPQMRGIQLSASGDRVWFGSELGIASIPLKKGAKATWILRDRKVNDIALGTKTLVAGCEDGDVLVVDLATNKVVKTIAGGAAVIGVALATDEKALAFATDGAFAYGSL